MARKGENIYKRKDGRWEGRYIKSRSSTGKANYGYVYAKSYREVKAKLISQSARVILSLSIQKLAQINLNRLLWNGFKLYVLK
jgi:hypothetical protein